MEVNVEQVIREYLPGVVHLSLATSRDPDGVRVEIIQDDRLK